MSEFTQIPVVCFDTNILIQMKGLVTNNPEEMRSMRKAGFTKSIQELYRLVKHGKIIPVITPTVLKEVLHGVSYYGYDLVDFIRDNNFLVFEVDREHRNFWRKQTNQLANSYCTKLNSSEIKCIRKFIKDENSRIVKTVFPVKEISNEKIVPINDARIMAEATYVGLPLITNNVKDFSFDNRANVISYINKKKGFKATSKPYTSQEFLEYYHDRKVFPKLSKAIEKTLISSEECEFLF